MATGFWGNLGSTILVGYIMSRVNSDRNTGNDAGDAGEPDYGVRLQTTADPSQKIPVVYGEAFTGGKLFDIRMTNDNQTMTYALVLSEMTGNLNLGAGDASSFSFKDIYWNNSRMVFDSDGTTAAYTVDRNGKVDKSVDGLVKVYCYNGGSANGVVPENYSGTVADADTIMPEWTVNHTADDLVFAIIEVTYNKDKGISGLGNMTFDLVNTMTEPGDCIYDYMVSTRYGASIPAGDISDL